MRVTCYSFRWACLTLLSYYPLLCEYIIYIYTSSINILNEFSRGIISKFWSFSSNGEISMNESESCPIHVLFFKCISFVILRPPNLFISIYLKKTGSQTRNVYWIWNIIDNALIILMKANQDVPFSIHSWLNIFKLHIFFFIKGAANMCNVILSFEYKLFNLNVLSFCVMNISLIIGSISLNGEW